MNEPDKTASTDRGTPDMKQLLDMIRKLVGEIHPQWKNLHFTPDTQLERELGLDSMARMELRTRIESDLGVTLDESRAIAAITPNDLLCALAMHMADAPACTAAAAAAQGIEADASELLMGSFGVADSTATGAERHSPGDLLYAAYAWTVFIILGLVTWLLVVLAPLERWRRKLAHLCARLFFHATFTPLQVSGQDHLDPHQPQIIVANHMSYLDGFIVTAALDIPIHFIVKGELASILPARILLNRFGVEFVDRFNARKGASDVRRIAEKSRNGQSIVFFPEGTFTSFPGLQPFRMGAFVTAARSNVPVVPVAIKGARDIVRGSNWFPYRGRIQVTIRPPVRPHGEGWDIALNLRNAARREINRYTGEPDLVEGESGD
jgi:1-acyl-sn-glycerol-3-phosphate acyltransferase